MKISKSQILILVLILVSSVLAVGIYFLIKHFLGDKNGWNSEKIQTLSDAMYKIMKADPDSMADLIEKVCVSQKLADCMATSISKNYPYDPKYAQNPTLNLPTDSKKYIIACFSTCLGTKNNWSKVFYNEVLQEQISSGVSEKIATCYTDYLQKNVDPIDLLNNTANIDSLIKTASTTCDIVPTCDCTQTTCGEINSCNQKCDDCSTCSCPSGDCVNVTCKTTPPTCDCTQITCGDTSTTCGASCTDCKICACPKGKTCYGNQCLDQTPDCNCSAKNCGEDNGCGGICSNCPDTQLCDGTQCVSIDSTRTQKGWTNQTIQELALKMSNIFYNDYMLPPVKTCTPSDFSNCMANIISNKYSYDDIVKKNTVVPNYNEILKMCTANYLGIKGQWSTKFYDAMKLYVPSLYVHGVQIPLICILNYLMYNYEPIDLNLANIQDVVEKAQAICYEE